ncbi:MAG: HAD family phosphatase [Patescibacteria group bacterium]|mgnify:FL=1
MSRKFAVFDIDGTLIRWQLYHAVVDKLASGGYLGERAKDKLHQARMIWKNREHSEAFADYEAVLIDVFESALTTLEPKQFDDMVDDVIDQYKDQVYTYTRNLLHDLKSKGYFLLAISGSHQELVEKLAKYYGFDDWAGTKYERGKSFSGEKFIASHNKQSLLKQMIKEHDLTLENSYAVGDSTSDAEMLEIIENPIAFNPNQTLLDIAKSKKWPIVLERKNVVYRLNSDEEQYVLFD